MTKLQELAQQLAGLYRARKSLQVDADHVSAAIEARQLMLTPAEGWPGKNDSQRDTARDKALAADPELADMRQELSALRDKLAGSEGEIEALQAVASAERWAVRERLADALAARQVERSDDPSGEMPAFSDAEDDEAVLAAEMAAEEIDDGKPVDFSEFKPATPSLTPTYKMLAPETEELPWHQV